MVIKLDKNTRYDFVCKNNEDCMFETVCLESRKELSMIYLAINVSICKYFILHYRNELVGTYSTL